MSQIPLGNNLIKPPPPPPPQLNPARIQAPQPSFLTSSIRLPWPLMLVFAGAIPFVPVSYLGYAGVNLLLTGTTFFDGIFWAALKATSQIVCALLSKLSYDYITDEWLVAVPYLSFLPWFLMFSPWYIYDILQFFRSPSNGGMFMDRFVGSTGDTRTPEKDSFRVPFSEKAIGNVQGDITFPKAFLIVFVVLAGLSQTLEYLPDAIISTVKPIFNKVLAWLAGLTAVGGGGVGAYAAWPTISKMIATPAVAPAGAPAVAPVGGLDSMIPGIGGLFATTTVAPPSAPSLAPSLAPPSGPSLAAPAAPLPKMMGGGRVDLDAIAADILKETSSGVGAYIVVGAMALVALGGGALSLVRQK